MEWKTRLAQTQVPLIRHDEFESLTKDQLVRGYMYYALKGYPGFICEFRPLDAHDNPSELCIEASFASVGKLYFNYQDTWRNDIQMKCDAIDREYLPSADLYVGPDVDREANKRWRRLLKTAKYLAGERKFKLRSDSPMPNMEQFFKKYGFHRIKVTEVAF